MILLQLRYQCCTPNLSFDEWTEVSCSWLVSKKTWVNSDAICFVYVWCLIVVFIVFV